MPQTKRKPRSASSRGTITATPRKYSVKTRTAQSVSTRDAEGQRNYQQYTGWRFLLNPLWCYHGFIASVLLLTAFGLVMVYSSSSVSMVAVGAAPWAKALTQGIFCFFGVLLFGIGSFLPYRLYYRYAFIAACLAIGLQALTLTPLGIEVNGNRGWIGFGGFTFQPAELVKLTLCVALPLLFARINGKRPKNAPPRLTEYLRVFALYGAALAFVLGGRDLGTAMILLFIGIIAFWFSDFPGRWMVIVGIAAVAVVGGFVMLSPNRMGRIMATYQGCTAANQDTCYQALHSKYAVASGGFWGVGLGNSREKWNYLPEAHNDFIYAIIGEETGFIGAVLVLLLFAVLAWCMIVIALQTSNRKISVSLLCFTVWIVGQALVNIGVVVGVLPVMGVPMPFVSAGGSSLIMCLFAAGICVSLMRSQPEIRAERARV